MTARMQPRCRVVVYDPTVDGWARNRSRLAAALVCGSLGACFSEASEDVDEDDDVTSATAMSAESTTTMSSTADASTSVGESSGPTTQSTTVVDTTSESGNETTSTTQSDTSTDSTTGDIDPACPNDGEPVCDDGIAVPGEVCLDQSHLPGTSDEQHDRIVIADVNGDDFADAVVGDGGVGYVLLEGDGQGEFTTTPGAALLAWSLDVAMLTEGDPARVLVGGFEPEARLFEWQAGSLQESLVLPEPGGGAVIARFMDFDGLNGPDIVTASSEATANQLHVYLGDGAGGFAAEPLPLDVQAGGETTLEDFRGLVDPAYAQAAIAILLTDGRLVLWRDGSLDVVDDVNVFLPFERPVLVNADLDGDMLDDLVVASSGRAYMYEYNSERQRLDPANVLGENVGTRVSAAVGDLDRNGYADVVIAEHTSNTVYTYLRGDAGFAPPTESALGALALPVGAAIGPLNGDCVPDLLVFNTTSVWTFISNP